MRLYLDCADRAELAPLLDTGLFGGVTTNPLILQRGGVRLAEVPALVDWLLERGTAEVFVQTTAADADRIVAEGRELRALSDRVVVKIPATTAGLTAARRLADQEVPVLVTAVYHAVQALTALAAGARWIAPYVGRMTEQGRDGHEQVAQMQRILTGSSTGVLAASLRSAEDVRRLALLGVEAVTVGAPVARALLTEPLTEAAVADFDRAVAQLRD
jgi:TalC/MipB family fructose-6-phosphate aldolase